MGYALGSMRFGEHANAEAFRWLAIIVSTMKGSTRHVSIYICNVARMALTEGAELAYRLYSCVVRMV